MMQPADMFPVMPAAVDMKATSQDDMVRRRVQQMDACIYVHAPLSSHEEGQAPLLLCQGAEPLNSDTVPTPKAATHRALELGRCISFPVMPATTSISEHLVYTLINQIVEI
jgi:hypothetical protein